MAAATGLLCCTALLSTACSRSPLPPPGSRTGPATPAAAGTPPDKQAGPALQPKAVGDKGPDASAAIFEPDTPLAIHIKLDDAARSSLERHRRRFTRATVTLLGQTLHEVGIRLKGHRTMQDLDEKPSFILSFDRFSPGRRLHGMRRLVVNAMDDDDTMLRETLGYEVFRRAGVPASRTRYATVKLDGDTEGLYLVVEPIDSVFLARHFDDPSGNLYEGEYGCDMYEQDIWGFDLDAGSDTSRADLKALVGHAATGVERLFQGPKAALNKEHVLAFLAVSAIVGDFDGYRHSHNYSLYHEPRSDKWTLIPWGIDRVFFKQLDIFDSGGLLAKLCFDDRACRLAYVQAVRKALDHFEAADLPAMATAIAARIDPIRLEDAQQRNAANRVARKRKELFNFLNSRADRVEKQLICLSGDKEIDADGDGHGCMDCAPEDPDIHPGAEEVCDEVDNDCTGLPDDATACACPSEEIEGATFHFCDLEMSWWDAAKYCESMGLHLARLDSKSQNRAVYDASQEVRGARWWIGMNDYQREGHMVWHDGSDVDFTRWKRKEPYDGYCGEDCAAFKKRGKGRWYDAHCGLRRPFICR